VLCRPPASELGGEAPVDRGDATQNATSSSHDVPLLSLGPGDVAPRHGEQHRGSRGEVERNVVSQRAVRLNAARPTVGILLCKGRSDTLVRYALAGAPAPLAVAAGAVRSGDSCSERAAGRLQLTGAGALEAGPAGLRVSLRRSLVRRTSFVVAEEVLNSDEDLHGQQRSRTTKPAHCPTWESTAQRRRVAVEHAQRRCSCERTTGKRLLDERPVCIALVLHDGDVEVVERVVANEQRCSRGDTDTVAAITGALAGAAYGSSTLPFAWRRTLHGWPGLRARRRTQALPH